MTSTGLLAQSWATQIPVKITLAANEITSPTVVRPVHLLAHRNGYLPEIGLTAIEHFEHVLPSLPGQSEKKKLTPWFDYQGLPLKWNLPLGVLYDLTVDDHSLPWSLTVHYSSFPDSLMSWENKYSEDIIMKHYFNSLKEAAYICRGTEGSTSIMKMDKGQYDALWAAVKRCQLTGVEAVLEPLNLTPAAHRDVGPRVPVRLLIRRGAPPTILSLWSQVQATTRPANISLPSGTPHLISPAFEGSPSPPSNPFSPVGIPTSQGPTQVIHLLYLVAPDLFAPVVSSVGGSGDIQRDLPAARLSSGGQADHEETPGGLPQTELRTDAGAANGGNREVGGVGGVGGSSRDSEGETDSRRDLVSTKEGHVEATGLQSAMSTPLPGTSNRGSSPEGDPHTGAPVAVSRETSSGAPSSTPAHMVSRPGSEFVDPLMNMSFSSTSGRMGSVETVPGASPAGNTRRLPASGPSPAEGVAVARSLQSPTSEQRPALTGHPNLGTAPASIPTPTPSRSSLPGTSPSPEQRSPNQVPAWQLSSSCTILVNGINIPPNCPIQWLYQTLHAPDYFLYVVVKA